MSALWRVQRIMDPTGCQRGEPLAMRRGKKKTYHQPLVLVALMAIGGHFIGNCAIENTEFMGKMQCALDFCVRVPCHKQSGQLRVSNKEPCHKQDGQLRVSNKEPCLRVPCRKQGGQLRVSNKEHNEGKSPCDAFMALAQCHIV